MLTVIYQLTRKTRIADVCTAISKKVFPVSMMRDVWSMFHGAQCTMGDSYCDWEFQVGNK